MFKNNDASKTKQNIQNLEPETIIGHSVRVEGNFKGDGNLIIEGEVKGSIKIKKDVRVGEHAKINANIDSNNAFIAGNVTGNVKVKEKLELTSTAKIIGDITAKILQTSDGAIINGLIKMDHEITTQPILEKTNLTDNEYLPEKDEEKKDKKK